MDEIGRQQGTRQPTSKSDAALAGAAGDGEVHDLEYWLKSGFLTLPKDAPEAADAALSTLARCSPGRRGRARTRAPAATTS